MEVRVGIRGGLYKLYGGWGIKEYADRIGIRGPEAGGYLPKKKV